MTAGSGTLSAARLDPVVTAGEVSNGRPASRPSKTKRMVSILLVRSSSSVMTRVCL
jgi:hypothetical protein